MKMLHWICRIHSLEKTSSHNLHKFPIFPSISLLSFSTSTPKISILDYLVNQHQFSPECASKVSSLSSSGEYLKKPRNADSVIEFLKENGLAKNHIETLVQKAPWILSANLEISVKPKIKIFQDLGFQSTDLADIVSAHPFLLCNSAASLRLFVSKLNDFLGPDADVCRFLMNSTAGRYMKYGGFDRKIIPNVEYLKSCGICSLQIATFLCRYPLTFQTNQEKFKVSVQIIDEMGVDRKSKTFLYAVRVLGSMSIKNWELKLKLFRGLGFSDQDISYAFRVQPGAFATSERKIKEVTELLLSVENFSISDIVTNPVMLTYSVEKRLKPRVQVFKALVSKNLLKKRPGFRTIFQMTNANFTKKYLIPYSDELGDLYVASQGS